MPSWRALAVALALAGYALLSHVLMVVAADGRGPCWCCSGRCCSACRRWPCSSATCRRCWPAWSPPVGCGPMCRHTKACIASSTSTCCSMPASTLRSACVFATTLRHGATPLISAFALRVHRTVTPELLRYTRQVTWAWSLLLRSDGGAVARAVRRRAVVVVVGVRQSGDAGGRGRAVRRRIPAALPAAPRIRTHHAGAGAAGLSRHAADRGAPARDRWRCRCSPRGAVAHAGLARWPRRSACSAFLAAGGGAWPSACPPKASR